MKKVLSVFAVVLFMSAFVVSCDDEAKNKDLYEVSSDKDEEPDQ